MARDNLITKVRGNSLDTEPAEETASSSLVSTYEGSPFQRLYSLFIGFMHKTNSTPLEDLEHRTVSDILQKRLAFSSGDYTARLSQNFHFSRIIEQFDPHIAIPDLANLEIERLNRIFYFLQLDGKTGEAKSFCLDLDTSKFTERSYKNGLGEAKRVLKRYFPC